MNYNFSKKWTLRILAAFFFVVGVLLVIFGDGNMSAANGVGLPGGSNDLIWFAIALVTLVMAEFCKD